MARCLRSPATWLAQLRARTPRATAESQPEGTAPAKRDWNRYKTLQQDLAKQGIQSLQQRGVVRDPNAPEPDPPEITREKKPDRGRSR